MSSYNRPQHKDRKYSDLTMKQKGRISEKTYEKHLRFYLEKGRMPDVEETDGICRQLFQSVKGLAPMASYEEFAAKIASETIWKRELHWKPLMKSIRRKHRKKRRPYRSRRMQIAVSGI